MARKPNATQLTAATRLKLIALFGWLVFIPLTVGSLIAFAITGKLGWLVLMVGSMIMAKLYQADLARLDADSDPTKRSHADGS